MRNEVRSRACVGCAGRVRTPGGVRACGACLQAVRYMSLGLLDTNPSDRLWAWRVERGLTQRGLSAVLGVHYSTVSLWETGKRPISPWVWTDLLAHVEEVTG